MAANALPQKSTTVRKSAGPARLRLAALRLRFGLGSWLMPEATLHRAYRLFGTPMPGTRERAYGADPGGARMDSFEWDGERLTTYAWGDPARQPTVLFAHGWSSFGLRCLPWVAPLQKAGYAVVGFDQVAHGRSSGDFATLPLFAQALKAVGERIGPVAAVIGHSLGGAAAMLAVSEGLRAERAMLIAPAADPFAAAQRFARFVGLAPHLVPRMFDAFEARTGIRAATLLPHVRTPALGVPALVVHDCADPEVPWEEGERYARHWPGARLVTTHGLGHHRIAADPDVIAAGLRFLRGERVGERVVSSPNLPFGMA